MKLIHCADLHLDSKMETNLTIEEAKARRMELLETFENMVAFAVTENVEVIMIAGDMFDSAQSCQKRIKSRVLDIIKFHKQIDFLYLQGNHDKDNYFKEMEERPENLKMFCPQWKRYVYGNLVISGIELTNENKQTLYSDLILNSNELNIVMMHGQIVTGRTQTREEDILLYQLQDKYIDYLALGHLHSYQVEKLDCRGVYCYSGCLEGRGYDECGKKGFVLLEMIDGELTQEFYSISKRTMHTIEVDITSVSGHNEILERVIEAIRSIPNKDYVKVVLIGHVDEQIDVDSKYIESQMRRIFDVCKLEDKSELELDYQKYAHDISLKGEFIRSVQATNLSETEKNKVIRMGLHGLQRKEII